MELPARPPPERPAGFTLVEMSIVVGLIGLTLLMITPARAGLDRWSLSRAAAITERYMSGVRLRAVAHREKLHIRLAGIGTLETVDSSGLVIERLVLAGMLGSYVDSVRIRPRAIRYNPRGHGAAGSIYLHRGQRRTRIISNFVGRLRRHTFRP